MVGDTALAVVHSIVMLRGVWHPLLLALLAACSTTQSSPARSDVPEDLRDVEIILVRSECGGGYCPNYTVKIDGNGHVKYTGRSYARVTGDRESQIPRETVRKLLAGFESIHFFSLRSRYEFDARDLRTTYLTLHTRDGEKRVSNRWPEEANTKGTSKDPEFRAHLVLFMLAREIDDAVRIEQWIGTNSEREALRESENWKPGWPGRVELDE
jgi:hypothetical protein